MLVVHAADQNFRIAESYRMDPNADPSPTLEKGKRATFS
ncbi:hypothetical protein ABID25_006125 [Mesorhizobium abyssinicae]